MVSRKASCIRQVLLNAQREQAPLPREFISTRIYYRSITKKIVFSYPRRMFFCYNGDMPRLRYIARNMGKQLRKGLELVQGKSGAILGKIPPRMRLGALAGLCLALTLILGILVSVLIRDAARRKGAGAAGAFEALSIPPEDFFLPGEPEFLPEILFVKEPRAFWTAEDIRPYWRDPLDYGPELWRGGIQSAVDELLERVP
jgi:hypothetical protein